MAEGKDSKYIQLISSDGHTFYVKRATCMISGTLKAMLQGPFSENTDNKIHLKSMSSQVLARVIDYFTYKTKYSSVTHEIPDFPIDTELAMSILTAANFLDCWGDLKKKKKIRKMKN